MKPRRADKPLRVLVTGATGFVGRSLVPALLAEGHTVRATTRTRPGESEGNLEWVRADLGVQPDLEAALRGVDAAYYLVHGMGGGRHDYRTADLRIAKAFAAAAGRAKVGRVIYLGGVAPSAAPSEHLASRLEVGEVLRAGAAPALELRASLIIGRGSVSWQVIRDLALRLPVMVLPKWTGSRTAPVALEDVVVALTRGLRVRLPRSAWFDLPGPEVLDGRQMLHAIAALRGREIPAMRVPLLTPSLSSWWLKLITRADFSLARELVRGFSCDLLASDGTYWRKIGYRPTRTFEQAARAALQAEPAPTGPWELAGNLEEALVHALGRRLAPRSLGRSRLHPPVTPPPLLHRPGLLASDLQRVFFRRARPARG